MFKKIIQKNRPGKHLCCIRNKKEVWIANEQRECVHCKADKLKQQNGIMQNKAKKRK